MQTRGKIYSKGKVLLSLAATSALLLLIGSTSASASVTGQCVNCHTMHNSQDGAAKTAGSTETLLTTDCVGCHSSTTGGTIVAIAGGINVPIVYNTTAYPGQPLAGGNFFNVVGNSNYGHNVRGIAAAETLPTMAQAPGYTGTGCASSCHWDLTLSDAATAEPASGLDHFNGCQGCHTRTSHHNSADPSYRFLGGHRGVGATIGNVIGTEDSNWEQTANATTHNVYLSIKDPLVTAAADLSIGEFCAGCHPGFHSTGLAPKFGTENNGGDDNFADGGIAGNNPWLRHPSDVNLPNDGEYAAMFLAGGIAYNPQTPVAQLSSGNLNAIDAGDQVTCVSCHRAHGSNFPDSLRFDYNDMLAHNGTSAGVGCFYCHTTKDNP